MRVIFLDIDGVLNTSAYRRDLELDYFSNLIDIEKMELLKRVVDATGAQVVLSTTWRKYWVKDGMQTDSAGKCIQEVFDRFAIKPYDKTPVLPGSPRGDEIWAWLKGKCYVEGYVILDDQPLGWEKIHPWSRKLLPHFVQTDDMGDGLTEALAQLAIQVLNGNLLPTENPTPDVESSSVRQTWWEKCVGYWFRNKGDSSK